MKQKNPNDKSKVEREAEAADERWLSRIIQPPAWFKKHMTAVRSQPHATLSEVLQQAKASEEWRKKLHGNRHGTGGKP